MAILEKKEVLCLRSLRSLISDIQLTSSVMLGRENSCPSFGESWTGPLSTPTSSLEASQSHRSAPGLVLDLFVPFPCKPLLGPGLQ